MAKVIRQDEEEEEGKNDDNDNDNDWRSQTLIRNE